MFKQLELFFKGVFEKEQTPQKSLLDEEKEQRLIQFSISPFKDHASANRVLSLLNHEIPTVLVAPDGLPTYQNEPFVMLCGSFNPLHEGHKQMLDIVSCIYQDKKKVFELSVSNADKGVLNFDSVMERVLQFQNICPLMLSNDAPTFSQKAKLFPNSVFVVGYDTAIRIIATRYYNNSYSEMIQSLKEIKDCGCKFVVCGRLVEGQFYENFVQDLDKSIKDLYLFVDLSAGRFRNDISSSMIREMDWSH